MKPRLNGAWALTIKAPYGPESTGWTVFTRRQDDDGEWEYQEHNAWSPHQDSEGNIRTAEYYFAVRNGWDFLIDNPANERLKLELMEVVASTHSREPRGYTALGEQLDEQTYRPVRDHNLPTH